MKFQLSTPAASFAANLLASRIAVSCEVAFVEGTIYKMLYTHLPHLEADEATEVVWAYLDQGLFKRKGLTYHATPKLLAALGQKT